MIVTKKEFRQALAGIEQQMESNFELAMSAAAAANQRAAGAAHAAETAQINAMNLVLHPVGFLNHPENAGLRAEVDALKASIERVDRVHQMILDYLNVEIVYVPERRVTEDGYLVECEPARQYIERKAKSRR